MRRGHSVSWCLGFLILTVCLVGVSHRSASAAPACYGCECSSPSDCDGCVEVSFYKDGKDLKAGTVYVKLSGTKYYNCSRTFADGDCFTRDIACWSSGSGEFPTTYKAGCTVEDPVFFAPEGSSLQATRTGCGVGP